ncbi:dual specificity tyrosine-phosphorylation-regulated kinase 4-like isoform X2 [Paramacrobiotus metropolitanus]|uniref:dual specificity tyrosine-phosphorylation-regulated kinase 4-like isoform X2 n=1 Tax=Paramacrobiotus metropolitanus TaxID=2943436 RepID=UPI002445E667|nr:dual specificity tyrosine-phosphorylation-regulated kinase 4-like isoform X2 [Paramacrobiotus metropolitanus]
MCLAISMTFIMPHNMNMSSFGTSSWTIGNSITEPKAVQKASLKILEREIDAQQRLPVPSIKPAVIISGRRPLISKGGNHTHRDYDRDRNDTVHYVLPSATASRSFKKTDRDRTLERLRLVKELRAKEDQARKAAAEEAKRVAAEEAKRLAAEEAKRAAAHYAESTRRSLRWPLTPGEVLHYFKRDLTEFELNEIQKYKEIWYLGLGRQRKSRAKQKKDDHDDGMYAAEAHDHVAYRYEIVGLLGRGSFGQVFRCRDHKSHTDVAIKMLRSKKKFYRQGIVEVRLLDHLRKKDAKNDKNIIHMLDCFHFRKHICIVLELAGINLYDLLKRNAFNGFSVMAVKRFGWNILQSLSLLQQEQIIHCDIKPENILLRTRQGMPGTSVYDIKVTDFGSGCFVQEQIYCYIQSRYYRAPEIILGFPYDCAIDIWSFACVLAELLLGRPIFPGENEADQLACIMEILGLPPRKILTTAPRARYFFDSLGNPTRLINSRGKKRIPGTKPLHSILKTSDRRFLDFMKKCLEWDPHLRATAENLLSHEWMTGPPGRGARDFPSANQINPSETVSNSNYDNRDLVAELLSTNPFNEDEEGRLTAHTESHTEDDIKLLTQTFS